MHCPACHGTGLAYVYEPWNDCQDCDGSGTVWGDDDQELQDDLDLRLGLSSEVRKSWRLHRLDGCT